MYPECTNNCGTGDTQTVDLRGRPCVYPECPSNCGTRDTQTVGWMSRCVPGVSKYGIL